MILQTKGTNNSLGTVKRRVERGDRDHSDQTPIVTTRGSWGRHQRPQPILRRRAVGDAVVPYNFCQRVAVGKSRDHGKSKGEVTGGAGVTCLRLRVRWGCAYGGVAQKQKSTHPSSALEPGGRDRGNGRAPTPPPTGRAVRRTASADRPSQTKGRRKPKVDRRRGRGRGRGRGGRQTNDARPKKAPLPRGVVHIQSSFNNTIVTVTNLRGRVIAWSSAGANGFKGARKATPFAAKVAARAVGRVSFDQGLKLVKVNVKGGGSGRETAMRGLIEAGLRLAVIRDVTGVPHNGCRPPKKRRV